MSLLGALLLYTRVHSGHFVFTDDADKKSAKVKRTVQSAQLQQLSVLPGYERERERRVEELRKSLQCRVMLRREMLR